MAEIKVCIPWYDRGRCINFNGMVYIVKGHGKELNFLPSGKGVHETWLERVADGPMTEAELKKIEEAHNG